jgi:heat shock protein HslJ
MANDPASARPGGPFGGAVAWVALLLIPLALVGCGSNEPTQSNGTDPQSLTGVEWHLDQDSTTALVPDVPPDVAVTIEFADGQAVGNSGCNTYGSAYQASDDGSIDFEEFRTTLMACPEPQSSLQTAYLTALGRMTTFSVGDRLTLRGGGADLTYTKGPAGGAVPLVGTQWTLGAIVSGSTITAPVQDHPATLLLAEDGTASGTTGCNDFNGTYTREGESLTFGPLATTRKFCEGDVNTQEQAFLQAMGQVAGFTIDGPQLRLTDSNGSDLLIFSGPDA